jgi:succinate dehydrogenase hydrophobic anchor subunit
MSRQTRYWTWHMLAGVIILVLLGLHMITMHLDHVIPLLSPGVEGATSWQSVVYRGKMFVMTAIYVLLLAAALYHGFYGLRTILFELTTNKTAQRAITVVLLLGGAALFVFGTFAAISARMALLSA